MINISQTAEMDQHLRTKFRLIPRPTHTVHNESPNWEMSLKRYATLISTLCHPLKKTSSELFGCRWSMGYLAKKTYEATC